MSKMKSPLSPSDIEVLIHHYACPAIHPRADAPAVQEAIEMFLDCGMMALDTTPAGKSGWHSFHVTKKGEYFIDKLCNTVEPVQRWE